MASSAIERVREALGTGEWQSMLTLDPTSGEVAKPETRALFASLPTITPASTAEELVEHGLLLRPPAHLKEALAAPRYIVGREVFVRAGVTHRPADRHEPVGSYQSGAAEAFTHRGHLVGKRDNFFGVDVAGSNQLMWVDRTQLFSWNEPSLIPPTGATFSGIQIDYNDPLMKALICAAYLDIAPDLAHLDFHAERSIVIQHQRSLLKKIAARTHMKYAGRGGYNGTRAAPMLVQGQGVCFTQRAALAGLFAPFCKVLAFDLQVAVGRTLRLGVPHGFLVVTLRPSLERFVSDPAWGEPLTDLRVAFFGPAWGHDRRLEGFEGSTEIAPSADSVELPSLGENGARVQEDTAKHSQGDAA